MNQEHILVCKQKHMLKSGAPPDNLGFMYRLFLVEFYCLNNQSNFYDYDPYYLNYCDPFYLNCLLPVWVPLKYYNITI